MTSNRGDEEAFLNAIKKDPNDNDSRLVYADWLETQNDPRAEYLRLEVQLEKIAPRIDSLQRSLDPAWLDEISRKVDLVLIGARPNIIMTIKAIRTVTGFGLKEAKDLAELADVRPVAILEGLPRHRAETFARSFDGIEGIKVVIGTFATVAATHRIEMKP